MPYAAPQIPTKAMIAMPIMLVERLLTQLPIRPRSLASITTKIRATGSSTAARMLAEDAVLAACQALQATRLTLVDLELGGRDRIAVRVDRRMTQPRRDQLLELLGQHMLEHLRLRIHAIPRHP